VAPATARSGASPHLVTLVAVIIFSANYVVGRGVYEDVPPAMLGFVRWAGAAVLLAPFVWQRAVKDWPLIRANWAIIVAAGIVMPVFGATAGYYGLTMTTATNGGILQVSLPMLAALLAWIVLGETLAPRQLGGIAISVVGVLYLVAQGDPTRIAAFSFNPGDIVLIFCNVALASYAVLVRKLPRAIDPLALLFVICAVGGLVHLPLLMVELALGHVMQFTERAAVGLVFVALFPSIVAILCWNTGIKQLGPSVSSVYMYLVPVFTAAFGALLLGERIAHFHVIGAVLIIAGVTLTTLTARPRLA
jgi:drug/metabolite transporter (DMT)-like permease